MPKRLTDFFRSVIPELKKEYDEAMQTMAEETEQMPMDIEDETPEV